MQDNYKKFQKWVTNSTSVKKGDTFENEEILYINQNRDSKLFPFDIARTFKVFDGKYRPDLILQSAEHIDDICIVEMKYSKEGKIYKHNIEQLKTYHRLYKEKYPDKKIACMVIVKDGKDTINYYNFSGGYDGNSLLNNAEFTKGLKWDYMTNKKQFWKGKRHEA